MRLALVLTTLALAIVVMLLFGAMEFDRGLLLLLTSETHPRLSEAARLVSALGGTGVLLAATGLGIAVLLIRREWRTAAMLFAITLSGRVVVSLLKDWTPALRHDVRGYLVPPESTFPSGHSANATMVWLCLALLLPRTALGQTLAVWAAVWLAIAVGTSRVMLGLHWPSDVIGGWAFGLFWTLLLLRLAGLPVVDGTPAPLGHSSGEGDGHDPGEQAGGGRQGP